MYAIDLVTDVERLRELYAIDCREYGESNVSWDVFYRWWCQYDMGLRLALRGQAIAGAVGAWGLSEEATRQFIAGQLLECDLQPMSHDELEQSGSRFWYISGLFVQPEYRSQLHSPLRLLLNGGIGQILTGGKIRYPAHVYALGSSEYGIALLQRLGFEQIKLGEEMPDRSGLWWKQLSHRSEGRLLGS